MKNIIVAVDFSDSTPALLETAASLATAFSAKLWLVHVAAPDPSFVGYAAGPQSVRDSIAAGLRREHRLLQEYAEDLRADQIDTTALLVQGPTVATLLAELARLDADHLVIGSHDHGVLYRKALGSISEAVLRKAPCPVTVVRPR
jgi:nucleotide-binding universal stress UspA family protein